MSYRDRFEKLYHYLLEICNAYHSWKTLQDKEYESVYAEGKYFWSAILISLQNEWLLLLAKCFEDSRYSDDGKVISVYSLLKIHSDNERVKKAQKILTKHRTVITGILRLRDHQLAHLNAEHLANPERLLERFPIKYDDVENLLNDFPTLLSLLNPEPDHGYILDNYTKEPEQEGKFTMSKIQYFDEKRSEHRKKFLDNEVDSIIFP